MNDLSTIRNFVVENLNLPCEQIGNWLWVGNTDNEVIQQTLLKQGFLFSKRRNMYYFREPFKNKYPEYTMNDLRKKYNSPVQLGIDLGNIA